MLQFIQAHWKEICLAATSTWIFIRESFNKIANALPAPTATDTERYVFWFKFVNRMAGNTARAENNARVEDSPNFIAAAENYMRQRQMGDPTPSGLSGPRGPQGVPPTGAGN